MNSNNDDNDEVDIIHDVGDVDEIPIQNQSNKENISASKYPFEIDKNPVQKQTTTSGKKLAQEVLEMYEQQEDGTYRCTLCIDKVKVSRFLFFFG